MKKFDSPKHPHWALRLLLSAALGVLLGFLVSLVTAEEERAAEYIEAEVIRIIDGDTYECRYRTHEFKVRVYGIDCAEMGGPFAKDALKATEFAKDRIKGEKVRLIYCGIGYYGRALCLVLYEHEGEWIDLGKELVSEGLAAKYVRP